MWVVIVRGMYTGNMVYRVMFGVGLEMPQKRGTIASCPVWVHQTIVETGYKTERLPAFALLRGWEGAFSAPPLRSVSFIVSGIRVHWETSIHTLAIEPFRSCHFTWCE